MPTKLTRAALARVPPPPAPLHLQVLEAGGLQRLLANPQAVKEAVVFAAATGALTCTGPGAIAAQQADLWYLWARRVAL